MIIEIAGKHTNKNRFNRIPQINDVKEYSADKICNRFAKYFTGVGKQFASKIPKTSKLCCLLSQTTPIQSVQLIPNPHLFRGD